LHKSALSLMLVGNFHSILHLASCKLRNASAMHTSIAGNNVLHVFLILSAYCSARLNKLKFRPIESHFSIWENYITRGKLKSEL
jgi:hypothetical protein